jgi:hypothetical protein
MIEDKQKEKIQILLKRVNKYFYWYLLSHNKNYIEKFFSTTKKIKKLINKA